LIQSEEGAEMVEYAFILLLIVLVVLASVTAIGQTVQTFYNSILAGFP
jgi:Flp pilus assembly pilin Flp